MPVCEELGESSDFPAGICHFSELFHLAYAVQGKIVCLVRSLYLGRVTWCYMLVAKTCVHG